MSHTVDTVHVLPATKIELLTREGQSCLYLHVRTNDKLRLNLIGDADDLAAFAHSILNAIQGHEQKDS